MAKVTAQQFNLFMDGKITQAELLGETEKPKKGFKQDPGDRKKSRRDEDDIQKKAMQWLSENHPHIPVYGNATGNVFTSGGLYRKALPKAAYGTLSAMGIPAKTWGTLLDYALQKLGVKITVAALEKDQEGAKFAQIARTKALGAVKSWPDIQVCTARSMDIVGEDGKEYHRAFHGLFIELKKPDAANLPWGKNSTGKFTSEERLQGQAATLCNLAAQGYLTAFAVGYDEFEAIAKSYLQGDMGDWYIQEQTCTFLDSSKGMLYRVRRK